MDAKEFAELATAGEQKRLIHNREELEQFIAALRRGGQYFAPLPVRVKDILVISLPYDYGWIVYWD